MRREPTTLKIKDLVGLFPSIDFPEYQREPNVWNLPQKRRLIDSIFRGFDISAIYFYEREDKVWECIDGRQRLNAIMSFYGQNSADRDDNRFSIVIENEVSDDSNGSLANLDGLGYSELSEIAVENGSVRTHLAEFEDYEVAVVLLRDLHGPNEFNLQFLRLNLGTLINAGEKLNAMVGDLHDLVFGDSSLGKHPFLKRASVPTRRFAIEQIAAQLLLQAYTRRESGDFARARHVDLQRFFKEQFHLSAVVASVADSLRSTLDYLETLGDEWEGMLKSRAITVSLTLLAMDLGVGTSGPTLEAFHAFAKSFLSALATKALAMRDLDPTVQDSQKFLIEFQRHVTQAAVEKPAVTRRHEILVEQFGVFSKTGALGD